MVDVERWLFYKNTFHVILLAKLHDMYLNKTDTFSHQPQFKVSLKDGSLTQVSLYWIHKLDTLHPRGMNSKLLLSRRAYYLFVPITTFFICSIGTTCIIIDPVFCLASPLLCLSTGGPRGCWSVSMPFQSAQWFGLYYATCRQLNI